MDLLETAAAAAVSEVHLLAIEELVLLSLVPRLRSQLLAADEMVCPELEVALLAEGLVVFQLVLLEVLVVPHHSKIHPATHLATPLTATTIPFRPFVSKVLATMAQRRSSSSFALCPTAGVEWRCGVHGGRFESFRLHSSQSE